MTDFAWFCLMVMVMVIAGSAPGIIRAWRCCCDEAREEEE